MEGDSLVKDLMEQEQMEELEKVAGSLALTAPYCHSLALTAVTAVNTLYQHIALSTHPTNTSYLCTLTLSDHTHTRFYPNPQCLTLPRPTFPCPPLPLPFLASPRLC